MQLGFVSAILPDLGLRDVLETAKQIGYQTVEMMCWPPGKAERRYAGVTHIDVTNCDESAAQAINDLLAQTGVSISALGYYPNPLSADAQERTRCIEHLKQVMQAARRLGIQNVNTFVGRDPKKTIDDNWPMFLEVWRPLVKFAEDLGLYLGIENCPMLFTNDEWPGGKNLAIAPAVWRRMFTDISSPSFGLNYDPSHFVWQMIDPVAPIYEFADRIFHVHAKDARVDCHKLQEVGILGLGWHTPKLPGMGDVHWGRIFGALTDIRYDGAVCVEVEDRAFEDSLAARRSSLVQSFRTLQPFVP
jgi:sugar phosphate isomerase/epimerase